MQVWGAYAPLVFDWGPLSVPALLPFLKMPRCTGTDSPGSFKNNFLKHLRDSIHSSVSLCCGQLAMNVFLRRAKAFGQLSHTRHCLQQAVVGRTLSFTYIVARPATSCLRVPEQQ